MLSNYGKFYKTALDVLSRLLGTDQLSEIQYWNAVRILPQIKSHPSKLKSKDELTFLFIFGSISENHPQYSHLVKVLNTFSIEDGEIYLMVRNALKLKHIFPPPDYLEKQKTYKARKRKNKTARRTINTILDQINDDEFTEIIDAEVDDFIHQFT